MSKQIKATTARGVSSLLKTGAPGLYSSGKGLYLKVNGINSGSWIFRYKINGKTGKIGLGSSDTVGLAEAALLAAEQRKLTAKGVDPKAHREAVEKQAEAQGVTFDMVAADYIAAQRSSWKNAKHAQQWENTLATYASPIIGNLAPADVTTEQVLEILQPIWNTKNETADRVRNRIEKVLNAAKARKLRTGENVAAWRGHLELLLAKRTTTDRKHHPALPWDRMSAFWSELSKKTSASAQALQLAILTGLRTGEILGAYWSEFDLERRIWTVPARRMKIKTKDHRVPLSGAALNLLETIPRSSSGLLFEGLKVGRPISNMAMLMLVRGMDETQAGGWRDNQGNIITPHGFRSTFRDWAAENTAFENIVVEQALAHTIANQAEAAYRRGDLLERRRELMEAWARYVTIPTASNLVSFKQNV
ncbi:tyrosine-type recombinase/integrase [Haliea sp. E1-2-M8]|uniref:tyrosine-type recombinase/integrase n=1 Tax=Haliea sp. E1-2-M8 TaxID=3064706 RepID=UPI00271706D1|nr:site-specific integrase [Haliea sp. E1-2-M8]MDO8863705.1 tyrosine-type recombinase/integrase [Haliea sp. E1-2-M8]